MSPGQRLVAEAEKWVGVRELPGNRGVEVDFMNLLAIQDAQWAFGQPWCASFVYLVGRLALGDQWPLPRTASCQTLADWNPAALGDSPLHVGSLLLTWYPSRQRYGHVGIITSFSPDGTVRTIEGNTNDTGGREGWGVLDKTRRLGVHYKVLNWE